MSAERYWRGPRSQEMGAWWGNFTVTPELFCIQMGSGVSHFNVSFTVRGKVINQSP